MPCNSLVQAFFQKVILATRLSRRKANAEWLEQEVLAVFAGTKCRWIVSNLRYVEHCRYHFDDTVDWSPSLAEAMFMGAQ